jgi:hypothetical protein
MIISRASYSLSGSFSTPILSSSDHALEVLSLFFSFRFLLFGFSAFSVLVFLFPSWFPWPQIEALIFFCDLFSDRFHENG